jgi:hypothetical protein
VADLIRRFQGDAPLRQLARQVRIDHTVLSNYLGGRQPSLPIALRVADNLRLSPADRREWFTACGLEDPRAAPVITYEPVLENATIEALGGARDLPADDIRALNEEMRRLIQEKRRTRGLI